ncbi:hypothetical protein GJ697_19400 [Pseudoduganella sp. FT25W]|uniref:Uncharacterized protein n=1 Tax=Duganella alba TaxID=2666081 RepID=A0A6L5QKK3_9BURK|nr:hypothetical protein [Duganella alba]MRX10008.1 hypothetical protein [Duganella alba]MRX17797.1 hypothetical protein [Duganella alba]
MPDDVFTKHPLDNTPLGRNTTPVSECDIHSATVGSKACKAIDVPILSCSSIWLRVQKEAEAWIAPGGKLIADPVARNRRINQAYAQLWLADRRFQWTGLAAFASKQVGCGLLHAADNIQKSQEEIATASRIGVMGNADSAAASAMPSGIAGSSAYMYQQLALGNTTLFLDIYPLHRFFMLRGYKHLHSCLPQRAEISQMIIWPAEKTRIPFGKSFDEILKAFKMIENNEVTQSVKVLAYHEQINILQPAIYDTTAMRLALDANQLSWATDFPTGVAAEIELTLSAECKSQSSSRNIWFSKNRTAKLYDKDQRMAFVYQAATRFDNLLSGSSKPNVEASIAEIAANGGIK